MNFFKGRVDFEILCSRSNLFFREAPILQFHNGTDIILRLPMGKRIRDIRWLSVWCRRFTVSISPEIIGWRWAVMPISCLISNFMIKIKNRRKFKGLCLDILVTSNDSKCSSTDKLFPIMNLTCP